MATFTWAKRITEIGLSFMEEDERKEKVSALLTTADGKTILNGKAVSELIDLCVSKAREYLDKNQISTTDADLIREQLSKIHGAEVVAQITPDELAEWVIDLKASV